MLRPEGVNNGILKVDKDKCTSCGLCIKNCPFQCWEMGTDKFPKMKDEYLCFSCFNCMIPCPSGAVSVEQTFHVKDGFFDTDFPAIKLPLEPEDAEGNPAQLTETERVIMERRSVRHFKQDTVPDSLIRRVLEAGRFAPSGGNHQPWKFAVVTDPEFLAQLEEAVHGVWDGLNQALSNDEAVMSLVDTLPTGIFDPRVRGGINCVAKKELPAFFKAPAVIFLGANDKMADPELSSGICGQNMNLAAMSLGLGCVWSNFGGKGANFIPELKSKLGYDDSWQILTSLCIGYPKFKQKGMIARHYRPVTWFRPGADGPQIEK
jgi:nitroreductase/NAD-dependent dihydropyrimidine dehydrogenase PreA subunit